nr:carboxymuconolactone decarboxylase family protein [uncultured Friedmanniella sp.]
MSYLDDAPDQGPAAELYAADEARQGYVPNYTRVFAHRPAVYRAWQALNGAVKAAMDPVRYEVATVAAAAELGSSYCSLAHGEVLARELGEEEAVRVATGQASAAEHGAVADLARKVVKDPASVTAADLGGLRTLGFSDGEILDVVLAAAARSFFSSVLEAVGAEPDPVYAGLPAELRTVLTVGRPIQAADG